MSDGFIFESLSRYVGRTVTIFTTSGGLSGAGFTGVLASISPTMVRLITDIGAPPACPVGSACDNYTCGTPYGGCGYGGYGYGGCGYGSCGYGGYGYGGCGYGSCGYGGYGYGGCSNNSWLGSITEIPIDRIASFTHNAI